ncbi:fungal specific transcription factor domain-containing protein [Phlyctema vagabunda]|uniref:Fungal specific transcription factor domain-containing protein n=1 Tax=Phlyctema vagabunda TaxID=108571 RepID=A0ABR4PXR9_9HELO
MEPRAHNGESSNRAAEHIPRRFPGACRNCRRRKVGCNHQTPCLNCIKRNEVCQYEVMALSQRRTRGPGKKRDYIELLERVDSMEALIRTYAAKEGNDPALDNASAHGTVENQRTKAIAEATKAWLRDYDSQDDTLMPESQKERASLVAKEGRSAYTTDALFAELTSQMKDMHILLEEDDATYEQDDYSSTDGTYATPPALGFIPGFNAMSPGASVGPPEPSDIFVLWRVFVQNVDSIMKLVHIPSMQIIINQVGHSQASQPPHIEALLSAIYLAAVISLAEDEVFLMLGKKRSELLPAYRFRLEQALSRANLLNTKHLTTLQAFVLMISSSRRIMSAQYIWMLTGLAIRIAKVLGLHRDGKNFHLSPFDCEMRRRLWWQIYYLELKASEESGCDVSISEDSFDTRMPMNINDEDISTDSTDLPPERVGMTDIALTLVRYELIPTEIFLHGEAKISRSDEAHVSYCEGLLLSKRKDIQVKYLRGPGMNHPNIVAAGTLVDLVAKKISLKLNLGLVCNKDLGPPSQETQDLLFQKSLDLIAVSNYFETSSAFKNWVWQTRRNVQWHAVVYILLQLCKRPLTPLTEAAWQALDVIFDVDDGAAPRNEDGLHSQLVLRLLEKAKMYRHPHAPDVQESQQEQTQAETLNTGSGVGVAVNVNPAAPDDVDLLWSLDMLNNPAGFDFGTTMSWDVPGEEHENTWGSWSGDNETSHQGYM